MNFSGNFKPCKCRFDRCNCTGLHSFVDDYERILHIYNKKLKIYEWGPGKNTEIALKYNANVYSVEFDMKWLYKTNNHLQTNIFITDYTSKEWSDISHYNDCDIYFIDSRKREICIESVYNNAKGEYIICLHDAQRQRYHKALSLFRYVYFFNRGFCFATNSERLYNKFK